MTATSNEELRTRWDAVMMRTYGVPPLALVSGQGCRVVDADGNDYLDLIGGIAVSSLGHAHPAVVQAVTDQVGLIAHTSNLVVNEPAVRLAERLVGLLDVPGTRVFLCNDGTTANEAAIKVAKRANPERNRFVAAQRSFHGRSLGSLALTGKDAIREPFAPFGLDVTFVPYDDVAALEAVVDDATAAVVLEPTLGEAGVVPPTPGYLAAARRVCDATGALLVLDEVQSGVGRTGDWFAHQHERIRPDVVTLAKGLAGGLPIGACLATGRAADALARGEHGSTFGGNPVACAAALAVLRTIEDDDLLDHARTLGVQWAEELGAVEGPLLHGVRGRGLWMALVVEPGTAGAIEAAARDAGFLVNAAAPDAVRLAPPLILSPEEAKEFSAALPDVLTKAAAVSLSDAELRTQSGRGSTG